MHKFDKTGGPPDSLQSEINEANGELQMCEALGEQLFSLYKNGQLHLFDLEEVMPEGRYLSVALKLCMIS